MEGDLIRINEWLLPLSWLYGLGVRLRNELFELGLLKSKSYDVPVISVGNITVGGTGKTPHTEYLIRLLREHYRVAVLSRGYKRKSKGFLLTRADTPAHLIGDEPYQMKQKFPDVYVAVDKNRRRGIERLCDDSVAPGTEVIILDDAFQHRYVNPGINILLVDYHRLICDDRLLPAGRLREPKEGKDRANIVVVTKCPPDLKPMGFRVISKALCLRPYQKLFFSSLKYGLLRPLSGAGESRPLSSLRSDEHLLLLTGIASPQQMRMDLEPYGAHITTLAFPDHHYFSPADTERIHRVFADMASPKLIVTTEKDAVRLQMAGTLDPEVRRAVYVLPVEIEILQQQKDMFNENIIGYVFKNSRNSILAKSQNALKP